MRYGTPISRFAREKHGNSLLKRIKTTSENTKTGNCHNYLYSDPIFSWSDLWYRAFRFADISFLSSNETAKSPVFESKSLCFIRRNGKFSEFDLKKTLLRCLRAIFGAFFPFWRAKIRCFFSQTGHFLPDFGKRNDFSSIFITPANHAGIKGIKMRHIGKRANPPRKKHGLSHTTRIKRRNRRAL